MKHKGLLVAFYLVLLVLLLVTWSRTTLVSMPIRLVYLGLLFIPLISNRWLFAPCLVLFWTIAQLSFGYSLMPTEALYYVIVSLVFAIFSFHSFRRDDCPYPLFVLFIVATLLVNLTTSMTIGKITYSSVLFLLLFITINRRMSEVAEMVGFAFILVSLICSSLVIFYQDRLIVAYSSDFDRIMTGSINYTCTTLGIGSVLALLQAFDINRNRFWRIVCIGTVIISFIALLLQASRGAILAVVVADLVIVFSQRINLAYKLITVLFFGLFVYYLYEGSYMDLLISRIQSDDGTGTNRLVIWKDKLFAFHESSSFMNLLFGIGVERTWNLGGAGYSYIGCHNDYLAFYIEYGVFGIFLFLSLLFYPYFRSDRNTRRRIIPLLVFILADCISLEPFSVGHIPMYFLLFYIYVFSISNAKKQSNEKSFVHNVQLVGRRNEWSDVKSLS